MKFVICHDIPGRLRIRVVQHGQMSCMEADKLEYALSGLPGVSKVSIQRRTAGAIVYYGGEREELIRNLRELFYEKIEVPESYLQNSGREMNETYHEKLIGKVILRYGSKMLVPYPVRAAVTVLKSLRYIRFGINTLSRGKLEVPVLDAAAIGVSVIRGDVKTAGSIMFLLGVGELLEEWTHKKSVGDLARSMALNISKVWQRRDGQEILASVSDIAVGDEIVVRMGNVIPFDGMVISGEGMVNQASLTGESAAVFKKAQGYVYAGTVLEEGELAVRVETVGGASRFERIVTMIEESEKLKSSLEGKAAYLADRLVPFMLLGTGVTYAFTGNITKALSVLMVDFSCALKLAMPISVLSAIREASERGITVKGGKFLEALAGADTIVFDKTGTLTEAKPVVADVVSFQGSGADELLRTAACMEEHFPHSMARAVVEAARQKGLEHHEMHSKVEYIVAHGISSRIGEKKVIIGSYHFVFEDERCRIPEGMQERFDTLPAEYSHLYMAVDSVLAAVICVADPLRAEAADTVNSLRRCGFSKVVMMTGDSERTAHAIAEKVGVDEYYSEVLPEDKARFVEAEKKAGRTVVMVGDGINDSPALSAADVGIAVSDGAEIAREIADIMIGSDDLYGIVTLKMLSNALVGRIRKNYRAIVGFNTALILLGVSGFLQPAASALLHNTSTLAISLTSMQDLLT